MTPVTSSEKENNTNQGRHPSFIPVDLPKKRRRQNKDDNETPAKKSKDRRKHGKFITNCIWTSAIIKDQNKRRYGVMSGFYGQNDERNWTEIYELLLDEEIDYVYTLAVVRAIQNWKDDTSPLTVYTASRELILAISDGSSLPECADVRDKVISLVDGREGTTHVRCVSTRVPESRKAHELASKLSIDNNADIRQIKDVNLTAEESKKENGNEDALIKDNDEKEKQQITNETNDEIKHQNGKVVVEQKETVVEVSEQIVEEDVVMIDVKQNDQQKVEEKEEEKEEETTIIKEKVIVTEEKTIKLNGNASSSLPKDKGKEKEETDIEKKLDISDKQVDEIEDNLENSSSWSIGLNIRSLLDVLKSPFRRANSDVGSRS